MRSTPHYRDSAVDFRFLENCTGAAGTVYDFQSFFTQANLERFRRLPLRDKQRIMRTYRDRVVTEVSHDA